MGFLGYKRPGDRVGIRNHVAVISTVVCANAVAGAIARAVPGVKAITHTEGCGRGPADVILTSRTLIGLGANPNVAAVLVVGLGCEVIKSDVLSMGIGASGKPVEVLNIQENGGSLKTVQKGIILAQKLIAHARTVKREPCDWSALSLGLECGGSDAMSGVTANPLVGQAADWLVEQGGSVILSETTEMIGTDDILAARAANDGVAKQIRAMVTAQHERAKTVLGPMANMVISPGNMDGGLSTIQEKSLGCIIKGGCSSINEVVDYGERPSKKGLVLMDTPGSDVFSLTAMAAGGAQLMLFTTGQGTPAGFPIVPVIKIASNSDTYRKMEDDMDVDAAAIIDAQGMDKAGKALVALMEKVAAGEKTKAEINLSDLLAIHTTGPSF